MQNQPNKKWEHDLMKNLLLATLAIATITPTAFARRPGLQANSGATVSDSTPVKANSSSKERDYRSYFEFNLVSYEMGTATSESGQNSTEEKTSNFIFMPQQIAFRTVVGRTAFDGRYNLGGGTVTIGNGGGTGVVVQDSGMISVAHIFDEHLEIGAIAKIHNQSSENKDARTEDATQTWAIGPRGRYTAPMEKFDVEADVVAMMSSNTHTVKNNGNTTKNPKASGYIVALQATLVYPAAQHVDWTIGAGYTYTSSTDKATDPETDTSNKGFNFNLSTFRLKF